MRRWSVPFFLLAEGMLYLAFLFLDQFMPQVNTNLLKYGGIILCVLMSLLLVRQGGDKLVAWALVLTLGADTFLLLLDRWYLVGILLFYAVQVLYLFRLLRVTGRPMLLGRMVLFAALLLLLTKLDAFTSITAAVSLYMSQFCFNVFQSLGLRGRDGKLFSWGLLLYFCCDLCVGIYNGAALFPETLVRLAGMGMWLFYLPGQVLITLSGRSHLQGEFDDAQTK